MAPSLPCSHCAAPNAPKRCGRCFEKMYCNAVCQRAAWKAGHKAVCVKAAHSDIPKELHGKISRKEAQDVMGASKVETILPEEEDWEANLMKFDRRGLKDRLEVMRAISEYWYLPLGRAKPSPLLGELSKDDVARALKAVDTQHVQDRLVPTCVPELSVRFYWDAEAPETDHQNSNTLQISGSTFDIPVVLQFLKD